MYTIVYKGVRLNKFDFFTNGEIENKENLSAPVMYDECLTTVCPECVGEYNLYNEAGVEKGEEAVAFGGHMCGVVGCSNFNSYVLDLDLTEITY